MAERAGMPLRRLIGPPLCVMYCWRFTHGNKSVDRPELIDRALEVSGERTKKAAVTKALQEFIARRRQKRLLDLMGKLEWDTAYDYKTERDAIEPIRRYQRVVARAATRCALRRAANSALLRAIESAEASSRPVLSAGMLQGFSGPRARARSWIDFPRCRS